MNSDQIRDALMSEMLIKRIGLRTLGARTGVSYATLSRFIRGSVLSTPNLERLECYVTGQKAPKKKVISQTRTTISGKTFLITIEEITGK